jgi:hypothetical protein
MQKHNIDYIFINKTINKYNFYNSSKSVVFNRPKLSLPIHAVEKHFDKKIFWGKSSIYWFDKRKLLQTKRLKTNRKKYLRSLELVGSTYTCTSTYINKNNDMIYFFYHTSLTYFAFQF